jgi:predicted neuraminidase
MTHRGIPDIAMKSAFWALLAAAFSLALVRCLGVREDGRFVVPPAVADRADGETPFYREQFIPLADNTPQVHGSTLAELADGNILAAWYGGTAEHTPDVALYAATFDRAAEQWGPARRVTDRFQTQREVHRYVKTVGNPVLFTDPRGTTWLYYATVSVGGWSGAAVNVKHSTDGGQTWTPARRLILSPILNMVTMVRTPPLAYDDGTLALPAYHQGVSKFPELVHLSADARVLDKVRMGRARASLQPSIVALGPTDAVAILRNMQKGLTEVTTETAGRSWSAPTRLDLPAPNSSIMAVRLPDGRLLLAFNNAYDRTNLSLAVSDDGGRRWKVVYEFPGGGRRRSRIRA